jgi:hypothetical protein
MNGLLDVATVLKSDGNWTAGYSVDALACGRLIDTVDICTPAEPPEVSEALIGYKIEPFVIYGRQKFGVMCAPDDMEAEIKDALENATEHEVARVFWEGGITGWDGNLYLESSEVHNVTVPTDPKDALATMLKEAYDRHPDIQPLIHLGILSGLQVAGDLEKLEVDYCISPGYPKNGMAVTGPVVVHLGTIQATKSHDTSVNRFYVEANRLAAVEFDPCLAVRAGT